MTDICASDLFSNQTICEVIRKLDDLSDQSVLMRDMAVAAIEAQAAANVNGINQLQGINYSEGTSLIDKTFGTIADVQDVPDFSTKQPSLPTFPDAPTLDVSLDVEEAPIVPGPYVVPPASTQLISDTVFDAIYNREADRLAEIAVKDEEAAVYQLSAMGIGMAAGALTMGLAEAQEETGRKISDTARDKATQEGVALREDVKTLHGLHIQNWPLEPRLQLDSYKAEEGLEVQAYEARERNKTQGYAAIIQGLTASFDAQVRWVLGSLNAETTRYQAFIGERNSDIQKEGERRGWSQLQINTALAEADAQTKYAIQKAEFLLNTTRETAQAIAQLMAGITQAIYSAASYHLGGSGSQNVNE